MLLLMLLPDRRDFVVEAGAAADAPAAAAVVVIEDYFGLSACYDMRSWHENGGRKKNLNTTAWIFFVAFFLFPLAEEGKVRRRRRRGSFSSSDADDHQTYFSFSLFSSL